MRKKTIPVEDENAVSEAIGYVIILGILLVTVGLVFAQGLPQIQGVRDTESVQNTERAVQILQDNINDITERGAPSRGTQIKLAGGQLSIGTETDSWVDVTIENATTSNDVCNNCNSSIDPIVFSKNDERVVYENGGIFRISQAGRGDNQVIRFRPKWTFSKKAVILPIINTTGTNATGGTKTATVLTRQTNVPSEDTVTEDKVGTIRIEMKSDVWKSWSRYFKNLDVDGDGTVCESDPDCSVGTTPGNKKVVFTIDGASIGVEKVIYTRHDIKTNLR